MDEPWLCALHANMTGKMCQILMKEIFPFSQFISLFILTAPLQSLICHYCLTSSCWECLILIICPVNFILSSQPKQVPPWKLSHLFLLSCTLFPKASLRACRAIAVAWCASPRTSPGAPPACDQSYLPLHHQHLTQCLPCSNTYVNIY